MLVALDNPVIEGRMAQLKVLPAVLDMFFKCAPCSSVWPRPCTSCPKMPCLTEILLTANGQVRMAQFAAQPGSQDVGARHHG